MRVMKLATVFLGLGLLAAPALADDKKPADTSKEVGAEDVKKWLAFFDTVVDTVVADKGSCDKMGDDLAGLMTKNADIIKTANEHKAAGKKLPKDAQTHMLDGIKKMGGSLQPCMKNEKVKGAFDKFNDKDKKK
jgi:hypothetical protein